MPGPQAETLLQVGVQRPVELDGPDVRARLQQGAGQRAETGTDLHHGVPRAHLGQFERLAHDVPVDEEILPQETLRGMPESREKLAGAGGSQGHRMPP